MYIKNIKINNFRNYLEESIELDKEINIFYGNNAQGKTNILESVFISAVGKSFRTNKEKEIIKIEETFSKVEINYEKKDRKANIKLNILKEGKKEFYLNDVKLKKVSEILGNLNIVIFSPEDIEILKNGPSKRRKFLDILISQLRQKYIFNLNQYNKVLEQRNTYLRQIKHEKKDEKLLEIWDEKLIFYAKMIYDYRKEYINKISSIISEIHKIITNNKEIIKIEYKSELDNFDQYSKDIIKTRQTDIQKGYTSKGIHRDDFYIYINDKIINIYGSQGQFRTAILTLKLCELRIIEEEVEEKPILLLDDFMSELDVERRTNFLKNIKNTQILITCTDKIELDNKKIKYFKVKNGKIER